MSNAESVRDLLIWLNRHEFKRSDTDDGERPLHIADRAVYASYAGLRLGSRFQPIARGGRTLAHEALLTLGDVPIDQEQVATAPIGAAGGGADIIHFDRLARTLHTLNFLAQDTSGDLHLNVTAHHLLAVAGNHGHAFEQILTQCGLDTQRIVLEIPEYQIADKQHLRDAIAGWKSRRYRIAIDNFGRDHLQLSRVLELQPDIIKLDGAYWQRHAGSPAAREKLRDCIEQIAARGIAVIATGVDTPAQLAAFAHWPLAMQGNAIGASAPECVLVEGDSHQWGRTA